MHESYPPITIVRAKAPAPKPTRPLIVRELTVRALWAVADILEIVRDGFVVLASKVA